MMNFESKICELNQKLEKISPPTIKTQSYSTNNEDISLKICDLQNSVNKLLNEWEEKSVELENKMDKYQTFLQAQKQENQEKKIRKFNEENANIEKAIAQQKQDLNGTKRNMAQLRCERSQLIQKALKNNMKEIDKKSAEIYKQIKIGSNKNRQIGIVRNLKQRTANSIQVDTSNYDFINDKQIQKKLDQINKNKRLKKQVQQLQTQKQQKIENKINKKMQKIKTKFTEQLSIQLNKNKQKDIKLKRMVNLVIDLL